MFEKIFLQNWEYGLQQWILKYAMVRRAHYSCK